MQTSLVKKYPGLLEMASYSVLDTSTHDNAEHTGTEESFGPKIIRLAKIPLTLVYNSVLSLKQCPKELYVNFVLNFCNCYSYFALTQILVIYLHDEFGVSDLEAGFVYGTYAAAITFWGLFTSWINDNLGVRVSLIIGFVLLTFATLLVACVRVKSILYFSLFVLVPFSFGVGMPMLVVGIKRYTTSENRGFVYGLYYAVMNIAAFVSGPVVDLCNIVFRQGISFFGVHYSGNRLVLLTASCVYFIGFLISYAYLREIKVVEANDDVAKSPLVGETKSNGDVAMSVLHLERPSSTVSDISTSSNNYSNVIHSAGSSETDLEWDTSPRDSSSLMRSSVHELSHNNSTRSSDSRVNTQTDNNRDIDRINDSAESGVNQSNSNSRSHGGNVQEYVPEVKTFVRATADLLLSLTFWRYMAVTLILISVTSLVSYIPDATVPTYLIRCYGSHYPKGLVYSINPFLCILLTPLVAALTSSYPHYQMIKYGSLLAALAPLCLVFFTSTWSVIVYNIVLSCGEAIWSPRTYDYTMSIAPEVGCLSNLSKYVTYHYTLSDN